VYFACAASTIDHKPSTIPDRRVNALIGAITFGMDKAFARDIMRVIFKWPMNGTI